MLPADATNTRGSCGERKAGPEARPDGEGGKDACRPRLPLPFTGGPWHANTAEPRLHVCGSVLP